MLDFTLTARGAAVRFLSQYPHEKEFLFPPCTVMQCLGVSEHRSTPYGEKRLLKVSAQVSNRHEDTSKIEQPETCPPRAGWSLGDLWPATERRRAASVMVESGGMEMVEPGGSPDGTASGCDGARSRKASAQGSSGGGPHSQSSDTKVRPRRNSARQESYQAADGMRPRARISSHADRGAQP